MTIPEGCDIDRLLPYQRDHLEHGLTREEAACLERGDYDAFFELFARGSGVGPAFVRDLKIAMGLIPPPPAVPVAVRTARAKGLWREIGSAIDRNDWKEVSRLSGRLVHETVLLRKAGR